MYEDEEYALSEWSDPVRWIAAGMLIAIAVAVILSIYKHWG
jgi:hypothetical protein